MALQARTIHIPAGLGIDESTREELIEPGQANLAQVNVRTQKRGGLVKRHGFTALDASRFDASTRAVGRRLIACGKQTCIYDGQLLDSYDATLGANATHGRVPDFGVERFPAATLGITATISSEIDQVGFAYANGMYFIAFNEQIATGTYAIVTHCINRSTRATVKVMRFSTGATIQRQVKLVAIGNTVICVYCSATGQLAARSVDASSASGLNTEFGAATTLVTDWNDADFDVCAGATLFFLAYDNSSGAGTSLSVRSFNTSFVLQSSKVNTATTSQVTSVAIDGSESDNIWVAFSRSGATNVVVQGHSPSALNTLTATATSVLVTTSNGPRRLGIKRTSSTGGYVVCQAQTTTSDWKLLHSREFTISAGATTNVGSQTQMSGWTPEAQPFFLDSRCYVFARFAAEGTTSTGFSGIFDITLNTQTQRPVGAPARGLLAERATHGISVPPTLTLSSTVVAMVTPVRYNAVESAFEIIECDAGASHVMRAASHNGCSYLSGGLLYGFDGAQAFEASFIAPPSIRAGAATAGGSVDAGAHTYAAIWEWTDAEGNVHWSEPSKVQGATTAGGNLTVPITRLSLEHTWKDGLDGGTSPSGYLPRDARKVKWKLFRTRAGQSAPFYLVTTQLNFPGGGIVSYSDTSSDATIAANAKLYMSPGAPNTAQPRRCPPSVVDLTSYNGLLCCIADDRRTIWHSAAAVYGEGAWFSDVWQYPVDADLIALAAMDGTLFVFTRSSVYAVAGEPPSDNGLSGGLGSPRRLAVDVGCVEPRSVVVTALGIFFQSDRGIELLTRGQTVEWIGEPVQDSVAAYPYVSAATLDPTENVVYFELAFGRSGGLAQPDGIALVYDLSVRKWVSRDERTALGGSAAEPAQDGALVYTANGWRYAWLDVDGTVYVEDKTTSVDLGQYFVTALYETPWIKFGLQQEQMLWGVTLLTSPSSAAGLVVQVAYDWEDFDVANDKTWAEAETLGKRQYEGRPKPRGQAMKFRVYDTAPAVLGTGEGFAFVGMSLDISPTAGSTKLTPRLEASGRR